MLEIMTKYFLEKDPLSAAEKPSMTIDSFSIDPSGGKSEMRTNQQVSSTVSSNGDKYLTSLARPNTAALNARRGK
jgi:hypothetical protein